MKRRPENLSDEALTVALAIARAIRETDGRLSARMALAELEIEELHRMFAMPCAEQAS